MNRWFCLLLGVAFTLLLTTPLRAEGGVTYTVTRLDDPTPDGCLPTDCSLREAVIAANATTDTDTIEFALDGTVELAIAPSGANDATTGDLNITESLLLEGRGAMNTVIDANQLDRVIEVPFFGCFPNCPLFTATDLTITGGQVTGNGGGVAASYYTTLNRVILQNNHATNYGGGVYGGGVAGAYYTITNSAVVSNSAAYGGGIAAHGGSVIVDNATVSGNSATMNGGGIVTIGTPKILLGASALIENSTIVFNSSNAGPAGAGIGSHLMNGLAEHSIRPGNNIVAYNTGGVQCGPLDQGEPIAPNLTTDGSCETTFIADPQIGPLADNGGDTLTHALGINSPALDSGTCDSGTDQRGLPRPVDLPGYPNTENGCDVGAYEAQATPPTAVTIGNWSVQTDTTPLWGSLLVLIGLLLGIGWVRSRSER
jgi:CSLREA domain-containing protein